jgi:hypothetical protein
MNAPGSRWADVNAALLAARGLEDMPPHEARALLALLHAGTLVELTDPAALRALDLGRLAWARATTSGTSDPAEAERAALGLLALGHRDAARARRAASPSTTLDRAWADWVGEGEGGAGEASALVLAGLRLAPAADRGALHLTVTELVPGPLAVRRLRVGGSVLDVEVRPRPAGLVLRIARTHGPALVVTVDLPARFGLVTVDDVEGLAVPLRFEVRDRHEVVAYG